MRRAFRWFAATALVAATVTVGGPASGQVPNTDYQFRFAGSAVVGPGIYLPGLDPTNNTAWTWDFNSQGCDGAGVSGGTPSAGAGQCAVSGGGPLLPDLLDKPACGNSAGASSRTATLFDGVRTWTGEIHWDGVAKGDPSYSLGSQLYLWGTMNSPGQPTAQVHLMLNASGGDACIPQTSPGGATRFTINGVGHIFTKVA